MEIKKKTVFEFQFQVIGQTFGFVMPAENEGGAREKLAGALHLVLVELQAQQNQQGHMA